MSPSRFVCLGCLSYLSVVGNENHGDREDSCCCCFQCKIEFYFTHEHQNYSISRVAIPLVQLLLLCSFAELPFDTIFCFYTALRLPTRRYSRQKVSINFVLAISRQFCVFCTYRSSQMHMPVMFPLFPEKPLVHTIISQWSVCSLVLFVAVKTDSKLHNMEICFYYFTYRDKN